MASRLDSPLPGPSVYIGIPLSEFSVNIVRKCGAALSDILNTKFGCVATFSGVDFENESRIAQQQPPTIAPEKRFSIALRHGLQVSVWKADLTSFPVGAVVNAANSALQHSGGLAQALSTVGGPQIQQQSSDYIKKHGYLNTGDAVVLDAGLLPCEKIIHAVGPDVSRNPSRFEMTQAKPLLEKVVRNILDIVAKHRLSSVAIPAISSGLFNYPLPECARTIVAAVKNYYECSSYQGYFPKEILLVNNDEPTVKQIEIACHEIFSSGMPVLYSQATARNTRGGAGTSTTLSIQLGKVLLTLKKDKIEEQHADVIVNTASLDRDLSVGQISRAILEKAGHGIQKEIKHAQLINSIIVTDSYKLNCKKVFHTFCIPTLERGSEFHGKRAAAPHIGLSGPSGESAEEAEKWLQDLLFSSSSFVNICNNFILHFGKQEYERLSRLTKQGVSVEEFLTQGHACMKVEGDSTEETVIAALQVEKMLCDIQKEFVSEEERELHQLSTRNISFKRWQVNHTDLNQSGFKHKDLRIIKLEKLENSALAYLFDLKKKQLNCSSPPETMFHRVPAQFCEMIGRIGFHAECAPPDDPLFGDGIYFARTIKKAMELWKEKKEKYLYFVEADVLTGQSTMGNPELILPPPVGTDPCRRFDSVNGGPDVSVIFSGYQALPKYIITCTRV
ncbi:protein mono-ADP-ribosyltransferase PARP9 [Xenentodon cancila]